MLWMRATPPHPCCPCCDMLVLWEDPNGRHINTALCCKGAESNHHRLYAEEARAGTDAAFQLYGLPLTDMEAFKYLGRTLTAADNDWPAVTSNLRKARTKWTRISRIIGREGENSRISGNLFKAVIHTVLLFGPET